MELAYDNDRVTALQIGTSDTRLKFYGFVGSRSSIVRFSFTEDEPLIGLNGFSTTYVKGLAPLRVDADCQIKLSALDALKAMWNETMTDQVKQDIRDLYEDYADRKEAEGISVNRYGFKTYQSQVTKYIYVNGDGTAWPIVSLITILIMLVVEVLLVVAAYFVWRKFFRKNHNKLEEEPEEEGGAPAEVIYVYKDELSEKELLPEPSMGETMADFSRSQAQKEVASGKKLLTP